MAGSKQIRKSFCALIILTIFFSCKKENIDKKDIHIVIPPDTVQPAPHVFTATTWLENLPPVMGGCVDTNGRLLTFHVPVLQNTSFPYQPLISAKILQLNSIHTDSVIVDFGNEPFNSGIFTGDTINGIYGWIPRTVRVSLACTQNGGLFMAYNGDHEIKRVYNGQLSMYQYIDALLSITSFKNSLYAMTSPILDMNNGTVIQQPVIYQIDSTGIQNSYFTFPLSINFHYNCGYGGNGQTAYPLDMLIDIKMAYDSSLYIASGYDNVIYKLDKNKNLSTYITDIFCPVSIDFDTNNNMYVVSAPRFSHSAGQYTMTKPVQIYAVTSALQDSVIYQGEVNGTGNGCIFDYYGQSQIIAGDANFNISINSQNQIFLENPFEGKILLIQ